MPLHIRVLNLGRSLFLLLALITSITPIVWIFRLCVVGLSAPAFFTMWNVVLTAGYFMIETLIFFVRFVQPRTLVLLEDLSALVRHLAVVVAVITSLVFWSLFFYDRELIFPRAFIFPAVLNHMQHSFPLLLLVLDAVLRGLPLRHRQFKLVNWTLAISYLLVVLTFRSLSSRWPYPFFSVLSGPGIIALGFLWVALVIATGSLVGRTFAVR